MAQKYRHLKVPVNNTELTEKARTEAVNKMFEFIMWTPAPLIRRLLERLIVESPSIREDVKEILEDNKF